LNLTLKLEVFRHTTLKKSLKESTKKKNKKKEKLDANDTKNVLLEELFLTMYH
jgi:hypothetical protein